MLWKIWSGNLSNIKRSKRWGQKHQNLGVIGREAFDLIDSTKKQEFVDHHLYVCDKSATELKRHLAFRDYLRRNPKIVNEYRELKLRLASLHRDDIEAYMAGKNDFISFHLKYALPQL